jgi:hypothetical protein
VEVPLVLQFSIALFTGMVASTFVPHVRKSIPKVVEVLLWVGLVIVCALGVLSITDPNARELSSSAAWGVDQVINTTVGLLLGGVGAWMLDHRFAIATGVVFLVGVDLLALALLRSRREGMGWQPRVWLRDWMEMPMPELSAPRAVAASNPTAEVNRRFAGALVLAGTSLRAAAINVSIGAGGLLASRRSKSLASLESLRDATAHLHHAARAWSAAVSQSADQGVRQHRLRPGQVVNIRELLSAQSIGWYGPLSLGPSEPVSGEQDATESERADRLAS